MIEAPYPELDELLALIGEAGQRLSEIDASEGAAGNISVCAGWPIDPRRRFPLVRANREVLVCGGSFNSPQLLQLSGVGPGELLQRHGIPVVHDAPEVGEQLQDHFYGRTFWRCSKPITLNDDMANPLRQAKIGLQWLLFKHGPLTIAAGYAAAFVRTRPELKRPDAQIYFFNFSTARRGGHLHPSRASRCRCRSCRSSRGSGSVRIRSADPAEPPAIRYNYLATEIDRRVMVEGLKLIRRIAAAAPLRDYVDLREKFPEVFFHSS